MSLLSTSYKILFSILLSRIIQYADKIIEAHHCGFRRNTSAADQIFISARYWRKRWEYNGTVCHIFIDFKKVCNSVRKDALYIIVTEFGITGKLVGIIKTI
jgi:hypothetical protein